MPKQSVVVHVVSIPRSEASDLIRGLVSQLAGDRGSSEGVDLMLETSDGVKHRFRFRVEPSIGDPRSRTED